MKWGMCEMDNLAQNQNLVEIMYYRNDNKNDIKNAIVTERQVYDIKILLPHIRIVEAKQAPTNSKRNYILL